jgi:hypothetical protein
VLVRPRPAAVLSDTDARTALAEIETELSVTYASLVAQAEPGHRLPLVDALLDTARRGSVAADRVPTFPGLPEQQG